MMNVTSRPRTRAGLRAVVGAACGLLLMLVPHSAEARPYTVFSCDSAWLFGFSSAAWTPFGNAGVAYASCPTGGGATAGISNRLVGWTYSGFSASAHAFRAPPGATITAVRWAGRIARNNCNWGTFLRALPSDVAILGMPPSQYCTTEEFDNRAWPMTFGTPAGTTGIDQVVICGSYQCAPGATMHAQTVEVIIDDPIPPSISLGGPLVSGTWVSGRSGKPHVSVRSTDNAGTQTVTATIGDSSGTAGFPCTWSHAQPCPTDVQTDLFPSVANLPDGERLLNVSAIDAAGNTLALSRAVYIDNTPPAPVVPQVVGGDAWRRTNSFVVTWPSPAQTAAPIGRAHWKLCTNGSTCVASGHADGQGIARLPALAMPAAGDYRLYVWLEDTAGNQSEANAVVAASLRFDPEPPQLTFEPTDPADPLRVVVNALDRHSGIASGEIEMRAAGASTWHGMTTTREGSQLIAYVDDEHFRNGAYEFRAHAVDQAGNEASTGRRADGSAATLRLPARIETRLAVGVPRTTVRRRVVRRHGRRTVLRRRVRWVDSHVVSRHGRRVRLGGVLANSDGQPIEGATIEALETQPEGATAVVGLATTDAAGKFRYVIKATRNRRLVFRYGGSRRIGSATRDFVLHVPASTSIRTDRWQLGNGQQVLFTGRVRTRPLPSVGKLVEMQAYFRGRWRTFSTVRAGNGGGWRFPYRFGGTVGTVTYRFRARLPSEGGYPFVSGNSRVVRVVVEGG
jgi:Bacterial Ig-like domain